MIIARNTVYGQTDPLSPDTLPHEVGTAVLAAISGTGSRVSLPSNLLALRRDHHRRRNFRNLVDGVHAGWDIVVGAGEASLPPEAEVAALHTILTAQPTFAPLSTNMKHPVSKAVLARHEQLGGLEEALGRELRKRKTTTGPSISDRRTLLYITHVSFPEALSGYTRRTDAVSDALRGCGLNVRNIRSQPHMEAALRLAPDGSSMSEQIILAADRLAATIGSDIGYILAASDWRNGWVSCLAAAKLGLPFAYEVRGFWELTHAAHVPDYEHTPAFHTRLSMERALARASDQVFTLSRPMAERLGCDGVILVPNGAEPDLQPRPALNGATLRLGYVGSLAAYEGLPIAVEAVNRAVQLGADITLDIVGDGAAAAAIEIAIKQSRIGDRVRLLGQRSADDAVTALEGVDAIIMPRLDLAVCRIVEPLKPIEALSHGVPVLASPLPVLEGLEGLRMASGFDVGAWTDLLRGAHADRESLHALGHAGFAHVTRTRQWSDVVQPIVHWASPHDV